MTTAIPHRRSNETRRKQVSYTAIDGYDAEQDAVTVRYNPPTDALTQSSLVIDYYGVLDQNNDASREWLDLMKALVSRGHDVCVVYHDTCGIDSWYAPIRSLIRRGYATTSNIVDASGSCSLDSTDLSVCADRAHDRPANCVYVTADATSMMSALAAGCVCHLTHEDDATGAYGVRMMFHGDDHVASA